MSVSVTFLKNKAIFRANGKSDGYDDVSECQLLK